jgi:hypothetical protein
MQSVGTITMQQHAGARCDAGGGTMPTRTVGTQAITAYHDTGNFLRCRRPRPGVGAMLLSSLQLPVSLYLLSTLRVNSLSDSETS